MIDHEYHTLYKRGVGGEIRTWRMERDGYRHRVVSGVLGGVETPTGWTFCEPKNVGRANATDDVEQAVAEIRAKYKIKRERGYFDDPADVDNVPFTKPMLAQSFDKRRDKIDWDRGVYCQPKLDGIRCIARADGLWTRTGKPITAVPHIAEALREVLERHPDLVLDGELYNHDLRDDFNAITSIVRKTKPTEADIVKAAEVIEYHVYDVVDPETETALRLGDLNLQVSLYLLDDGPDYGPVHVVQTHVALSSGSLDRLYEEYLGQGYEGQMVRIPGVPYEHKRSNALLKRKEFLSDEFEVVAVEEGNGNWHGYAKRFVLRLPDGRTFGAGVRGVQAALELLLSQAQAGDGPTWATVRYFNLTPDGIPRFPVVVDYGSGARED